MEIQKIQIFLNEIQKIQIFCIQLWVFFLIKESQEIDSKFCI